MDLKQIVLRKKEKGVYYLVSVALPVETGLAQKCLS
jgi:hypothetical protein